MSRRVALLGAAGQLGSDLRSAWPEEEPGAEIVGLTHQDVDVTDPGSLREAVAGCDLILNTTAFHRVDDIEDDPGLALRVNAGGARNVGLVGRDLDIPVMHLSTDYVFSGRLGRPLAEEDVTDPINAYGVSKVAGEMLLRYIHRRHFIVRSSGLYGVAGSAGKGGNFVETMLRLAGEGRPLRVVDDQVLTPTATLPLARQLISLSKTEHYGTFHATCQGACSWFEFAAEIFRQAGLSPELAPQTTAESGARATRPPHSVLENRRLQQLGLDRMPDWRDALAGYMTQRRDRATRP